MALRVENESDASRTSGLVKYEIVETIVIRPSNYVVPKRRFKYASISLSALHVPLHGTPTLVSILIVFALHSNGIAEVFAIPLYSHVQGPYSDYMLEVHVHHDAPRCRVTQQYHVIAEYRTTKSSGPVSPTAQTPKIREWLGGVIVLRCTRIEKTDTNSLDYGNVTEGDRDFLVRILEKGDPTSPLNPNSFLNVILHRAPDDYMMSS
ncbi:hypothetical protein CALVIDRAFT_531033 [Calocera viscosa TUFC12733]|uniref:Uncharacterized protein n=1 Tax=Calocera viscosa (strain TUFC12733) TaxID=1330018 RepID=A0A167H1M3_CALVF|nr:hypothetical protein CALVIDRAFT_531033 [Calocera viscosa TUFC12733]